MSKLPDLFELQRDNATLRLANNTLRQHQAQLVTRLLAQEQLIASLTAQVASLQAELQQRPPQPPAAAALPAFIKPKRKAQAKRPLRAEPQPRQAHGRQLLPATAPDQYLAYDHCPTCNYQLSGQSEAWRHQVLELPPPQPLVVTNYIYLKRYCPGCGCYQTPAPGLPGITIGQSHFGVGLVAHLGWLRTLGKLPLALMVSYLYDLYHLEISEGEVCYLLDQLAAQGQAEAEQIYQQLIASPSLHIDETGWKVNAKSGYIWAMANRSGLRYYHHSMSRGGAVARQLLTGFAGVFHSDFYAGYNQCTQQRQCCWVHLLRDLHELGEEYGKQVAGLEQWLAAVRRLYRVGKWLGERDVGQEVRERWYQRLVEKLGELARRYNQQADHPAQTLSKPMLDHEHELFVYVRVVGVSADNNLAERSVRPLAVARKISGGSRSEEGAATRMRLQTLFGTWLAKGLNPLAECLRMLAAKTSLQPV
jgi:transposase